MYKHIKTFKLLALWAFPVFLFSQKVSEVDVNVVYGEKHIFTIETPENWINDKNMAQKLGLVCFFYPESEINKTPKNYCFANGIDKESKTETLADFIDEDLRVFRDKNPDFDHETFSVEFEGGIENGVLFSFSNLKDKYKEEVIYTETEDAFIIFSFSAVTEEDYINYQPVFDTFVASFVYRGNNPQPFLEHLNGEN